MWLKQIESISDFHTVNKWIVFIFFHDWRNQFIISFQFFRQNACQIDVGFTAKYKSETNLWWKKSEAYYRTWNLLSSGSGRQHYAQYCEYESKVVHQKMFLFLKNCNRSNLNWIQLFPGTLRNHSRILIYNY